MLEVHAVSCTLILTLVMAVASPHLLGVERAWADSVIKATSVGNCVTNFPQSIGVGIHPVNIAYDSKNNRVYVANAVSNSVSVIDACTLKVIRTIPVGGNPLGITYDSK